MSKRSRKRNQVLAAMVGLAGASKLGLLNKMPKSITGDKFAAARKAMTSDTAMKGASKVKGDAKNVLSSVIKTPRTRTGQIAMGEGKTMVEKILNPVKARGTTRIGFTNRSKGGTMVKARGGGMAMRMKPTKMY